MDVSAVEALLRPLDYDGPVNVDFKRRADGRICILEVNPRLGGSLMRPENARDLRAALREIVSHGVLHPAGVEEPVRAPALPAEP